MNRASKQVIVGGIALVCVALSAGIFAWVQEQFPRPAELLPAEDVLLYAEGVNGYLEGMNGDVSLRLEHLFPQLADVPLDPKTSSTVAVLRTPENGTGWILFPTRNLKDATSSDMRLLAMLNQKPSLSLANSSNEFSALEDAKPWIYLAPGSKSQGIFSLLSREQPIGVSLHNGLTISFWNMGSGPSAPSLPAKSSPMTDPIFSMRALSEVPLRIPFSREPSIVFKTLLLTSVSDHLGKSVDFERDLEQLLDGGFELEIGKSGSGKTLFWLAIQNLDVQGIAYLESKMSASSGHVETYVFEEGNSMKTVIADDILPNEERNGWSVRHYGGTIIASKDGIVILTNSENWEPLPEKAKTDGSFTESSAIAEGSFSLEKVDAILRENAPTIWPENPLLPFFAQNIDWELESRGSALRWHLSPR